MTALPVDSRGPALANSGEDDDALQARLLEAVSRTFALTIPELPGGLGRAVANAYLLCRMVDTIEDEPAIPAADTRRLCDRFVRVVAGAEAANAFAADLAPRLSPATPAGERELVAATARVLAITHALGPGQRTAVERCVRIMADGMAAFQEAAARPGLADVAELDRYCYHVAGVVGEMLTDLFCLYSPEMATRRDELLGLAVSFGEGLQLTNILKDVWEDARRGACWLPRDVFTTAGYDLSDLGRGGDRAAFRRALLELVGKARRHLDDAVRYSLLVPRHERGIRVFCLWAVGMALLTLRRIAANPDFAAGAEVKISRRAVRATRTALRLTVRRDAAVRWLARLVSRPLPA